MMIPELVTDRLRLRAHRLDDFPALCEIWREDDIPHFLEGLQTPEAVWSRLLRASGHWLQLGFGSWVLECRGSGRLLGEAGLVSYQRALSIPMPDAPEALWKFHPEAQLPNLAEEAMGAVMAWGDAHLSAPRSFALYRPEDEASIALARRLGFGDLRPLRYGRREIMMMTRPRGTLPR